MYREIVKLNYYINLNFCLNKDLKVFNVKISLWNVTMKEDFYLKGKKKANSLTLLIKQDLKL